MRVIKRNGETEEVSFDKVLNRIRVLSDGLTVDYFDVAQKVCGRIYDLVKTTELDELAANICSSMIIDDPDYGTLAARISISNHHKNTSPSFSETIYMLYFNKDTEGNHNPIINEQLYNVVMNNKEKLNNYIDYQRDYTFDFFGFKTLERSYLLKVNGKTVERPQHMIMRVAIGIHGNDIKDALQTYDMMSKKYFTHATPTLFNAGTPRPQLSSCFLLASGDSIEEIFDSLKECALISKHAGGIGIHIHDIRAKGSLIRGTNGSSDGIVPMLKVYNHVARYINQCFTPETIVYTRDGIKRMDQVTCEDYLLTNDSTFRKVYGIAKNTVNKEILQIQTEAGVEAINVTPEHEIYVIKNGDLNNKPEFILAKDLQTTDLVGYPIPEYEKDIDEYTILVSEKYIHPSTLHLPVEKLRLVVKELMKGSEVYISPSFNQIMDLRYILLRLGIMSTASKVDNIYELRIIKDVYKQDNIIWSRIQTISTKHYEGDVYDFNMTDNHNYTVASLGVVHNSGKRNGSIAVYLEPWHADIFEFLDLKRPHGSEEDRARDLFYALWVPDLFMKRVKDGGKWSLMCPDQCKGLSDHYGESFDELYERYESEGKYVKQVDAQQLWFRILESQIESGVPYLVYKDAANKKSNQQNLGTIKSSNLCVAPETMILTDKGYFPISLLKNQPVNVWNGKEFSSTVVKQTGVMQKLINITFNNGMKIRCTPYHKFYIDIDNNGGSKMIEAKDLKIDMRIIDYTVPKLDITGETMEFAYTQGLFTGIEWQSNQQIDRDYICVPFNVKDKYFVPINFDITSKIKWFEGFMDAEGHVIEDDGVKTFKITNTSHYFLTKVFLMLQTLGVKSKISVSKNIFYKFFPDKGLRRYDLIIDNLNISRLVSLGFAPKKIDVTVNNTQLLNVQDENVYITGIEDKDQYDDTYCFDEPKEHKGIFNGIITGQCSEIIEYSSSTEVSVCNLASICLPTFVEYDSTGKPFFNFDKLHDIAMTITKNLNKVIDINYYPLEKTRRSNLRHRPIGIGVQGLADAYILMRYPFDSPEAHLLNKQIFETIYHGALEQSMKIAKTRHEFVLEYKNTTDEEQRTKVFKYLNTNRYEDIFNSKFPGAYSTFDGSPAQHGLLQFDLWKEKPLSDRYDWDSLKKDITTYGIRNSLLLAPMPTASTSQIMAFNEAFEPFTSNLYKRKTLAGEFIVINKYLVKDLMKLNMWTKDIKNKIIIDDGSIQDIDEIPQDIKDLYKTAWELKQKVLIDQAADRGIYVCQSQSMNLFMSDPDFQKLTSMHFYAWSKGLKTGIYYLRSRTKAKQQKFTVDPSLQKLANLKENKDTKTKPAERKVVCTDEICISCSS